MSATCAACLEPIHRGDKFVLSGTEVFHGRCAIRVGTAASENARLKRRVIDAETEARILRDKLEYAQRELETEKRRAREMSRHHDDADRDYKRVRGERDTARADVRAWRDRAQLAELERDQARRALSVANAAIDRQAQPIAAPAEQPVAPADQAKNDLDDAATRFSLLELDLP